MATHPSIGDLLCLLNKWRHFPAFPLEPRSETLFALFLPTVLRECKSVGVKVKPQIIPQFPLRHDKSNQSDKVDFFALSEDGSRAFFIELKTDVSSRRRSQDDYLSNALNNTMCSILYDYSEISKSKNDKHARQKYFHMSYALSELGLFKLEDDLEETIYADHSGGVYDLIDATVMLASPTLEVVYVQPRKSEEDKCDGGRIHYIYFDEFADCVENQGELGALFASNLRDWKTDPAKYPPRKSATDRD